MLRRYAITNAVYQPRQCDVVSLSLISNNQPFGYLHLILRWAASAQVETHQRFREIVKPFTNPFNKIWNRQRVVFQHDYPARLLSRPLKRAPMIPVRSMILFIEEEMGANTHGQRFSLPPPGVMADYTELKFFSHQRSSIKKAARWRLLSEYQGVASL
ncbi:Uncharacterised protein [Enterobacter hormaechei]|nr:Uncharacterised protein [Enterobacter hormaechei]VAF69377.1 Uncharacterised protein [Enterobacter hormaechei]